MSGGLWGLVPSIDVGAAWLLTYAIHSTLLFSLAWAMTRVAGRRGPIALRHPAVRDALWKTVLLGAVLTASVQTAIGSPLGQHLELLSPTSVDAAHQAGSPPADPVETPRQREAPEDDVALAAGGTYHGQIVNVGAGPVPEQFRGQYVGP